MAKIIEGRWDCSYCSTKGILSRHQQCPNCGRVRSKDFVPYLPDDISSNYVSEEEAKKINKNPDWMCSYCDSYCSDNVTICPSCGATRTDSELNYFEVQKKNIEKQSKMPKDLAQEDFEENSFDNISSEEYEYSLDNSSNPIKSFFKKPFAKISLFSILTLLFIAGIIYLFLPKEVDLNVSELSWSRTIDIERYQTVQESDWELPSEARLLYSTEEFHHSDEVLDHYETKTTQVPEERLSGHTENITYKDLGNGYFEEKSEEIPIYETYYETVEYKEPVYTEVAIYKTKYYYEIDKWLYERSIKTSGSDKSPYWGEISLNENERVSNKSSSYEVTGTTQKGKKKTYELSYDDWKTIEVGQTVKLKVSLGYGTLVKE